jgi:hypothetical protein
MDCKTLKNNMDFSPPMKSMTYEGVGFCAPFDRQIPGNPAEITSRRRGFRNRFPRAIRLISAHLRSQKFPPYQAIATGPCCRKRRISAQVSDRFAALGFGAGRIPSHGHGSFRGWYVARGIARPDLRLGVPCQKGFALSVVRTRNGGNPSVAPADTLRTGCGQSAGFAPIPVQIANALTSCGFPIRMTSSADP